MLLRDLLLKVDTLENAADLEADILGICYDTRKLKAGELFVAIRGYESDGHQHIENAVKNGAICIICEEEPKAETPYIIVENARKALAQISAAWFDYPAKKLKLVGVTGTNGKTTVTNLLKQVIEQSTGAKAGLIGTNGNMIGDRLVPSDHTTPESYEIQKLLATMVREDCEYAVMEVSSHALSLDRVYGMEFDVGIYTNLSPEHLDFHGTMEKYAYAKSVLFSISRVSVINIDDKYAQTMLKNTIGTILTYAINDSFADVVGKNVKLHVDGVEFGALTVGSLIRVVVGIPGLFTVYNALAVITAAHQLGIDFDEAATQLQKCNGVKGRAEVVQTNCDYTVMIDYAHTPDALEKIIVTAKIATKGRVITLFGCGGDRDREKRPLMGNIAAILSDMVIVTSDNPRTEDPTKIINDILAGMENTRTPFYVIENRREAIHWALDNCRPDDTLILAGKGHETYQIIGKEKTDFDERTIVRDWLKGSM